MPRKKLEIDGEFDEEFLAELRAMDERPPDDLVLTTVASEEERLQLVAKDLQEIEAAKAVEKAAKRRTYVNSEIPVRPCTNECPHRNSCKDFLNGRVIDKDLCKPELRQIKKWQVAFRRGDVEPLKDDAGAVAGAMVIQINRLLEKVIEEGAVVETTKEGRFGTYTEKMAHPALQQALNLMKGLGIDMNQFLMTPKSNKDAPPTVQVNIGISADEIHNRFAARYGQGQAGDDL